MAPATHFNRKALNAISYFYKSNLFKTGSVQKQFDFGLSEKRFWPFLVPGRSPEKNNGCANLRSCIISIKCVIGLSQALFVAISCGMAAACIGLR